MLVLKRLDLVINSAIPVFENRNFQASKAHHPCKEPRNKQAR